MHTPSTFDWVAPALTFLVSLRSFTDVESFKDLFSSFPLSTWIIAVLSFSQEEAAKRRYKSFTRSLLSFHPSTVRQKFRTFLTESLTQGGD